MSEFFGTRTVTSGKWARQGKPTAKDWARGTSSSFASPHRGGKTRLTEGHYTVFHGGRCAIDPKLRPCTESHAGVKYCDSTGKAANPKNLKDTRGSRRRTRNNGGAKADAVVCRRTPGLAFSGLTASRNIFNESGDVIEEKTLAVSASAPLYKTEGDISRYKPQMSAVQQMASSNKDRFTPLMWGKQYDAANEEACLRQDTCTPGAGRYNIDRRPKPLQSSSLTDTPIQYSQLQLNQKGSVYARSTAQLGLSSSFHSTVNSAKPKRNDRLSYMNEKGWSFVNDSKLTIGHPVCFGDRDQKLRNEPMHFVTNAQRRRWTDLISNQADIGYQHSLD